MPEKRFSLKTVCTDFLINKLMSKFIFNIINVGQIGLELLDRIQKLHNFNYVYRDIKPENIVVGDGIDYQRLYLIDFGLSKTFIDINGDHIKMDIRTGLVGTTRYASINSHKGY